MFYLMQKFEPSSSMRQMGWMSFEGFARYSKNVLPHYKRAVIKIVSINWFLKYLGEI